MAPTPSICCASPREPWQGDGHRHLGTLAANLPGWWQLLRQSPLNCGTATVGRRPTLAQASLGHRHPAALRALSVAARNRPHRRPLRRRGWLLAMALALPDALRAVLGRLDPARRPLTARLGVAETQYHLDRTAIAVMALQLAIAAAIGIRVMVSSFRSSVEIWLGQRLAADLYVTAPKGGRQQGRPRRADPQHHTRRVGRARRLPPRRASPPAGRGSPLSGRRWTLSPSSKPPIRCWPGAGPPPRRGAGERTADGAPRGQGGADTRSHRRTGPRALTVTGVYQDYGSEKGRYCTPSRTGPCNPSPSLAQP